MPIKRHEFSILKLTIVTLIIALHVTLVNAAVGDVLISDASKTLSVGDVWFLEEGYMLTVEEIDPTLSKIWIALYKNGIIVSDSIMDLSNPNPNWVCEQNIGGELDVVILRVTLNAIPTSSTAILSSLYQYSDGTIPNGAIEITSTPTGASIYLDGMYDGGHTPLIILEIPVGTHTIKLTKSGYNDISKTITVSSGMTTYVSETLLTQTGTISVSSNPSGVNVYLDGAYKGTTPTTLYDVLTGSHTVKLTKSGYNDVSSTVTVSSDQTTSISKTLTVQSGSISVSSNPTGANIYLDGTYKGTTPKTLNNVPIGSHTVKLTKTGYNDVSSVMSIV